MVFGARRGVVRDDEAGFGFPLFHQAVNLWQEHNENADSAKQKNKKRGDCMSDDVRFIHCSGALSLPLFHQAVNLRQEHNEKDDSEKQKSKKKGDCVFDEV